MSAARRYDLPIPVRRLTKRKGRRVAPAALLFGGRGRLDLTIVVVLSPNSKIPL